MTTERKTNDKDLAAGVIIAAGLAWALSRGTSGKILITAGSDGAGRIDPAGDVEVDPGDSAIFEIIPDSGAEIIDVLVDGVSVGQVETYTFEDVQEEHSIFVQFTGEAVWTLMAEATMSVKRGIGTADWTLMAEAVMSVKRAVGTAVWTLMAEAVMSVKRPASVDTKIKMEVKISPAGAGTIMIGGGGPFVNGDNVGLIKGQSYVYSAWPSTGYEFVSFNGFFGSVENGVSAKTPSADTWIQANFKTIATTPTYADLTLGWSTGGNVSRSPSGSAGSNYYRYPLNTVVTLGANPLSGYHFKQWENGAGQVILSGIPQIKITMDMNITIKAVFEKDASTPVEPTPPVEPDEPGEPTVQLFFVTFCDGSTGTYNSEGLKGLYLSGQCISSVVIL